MLEVYAVKINDEVERDKFEKVLHNLPEDKKEKIKKFRRFEDGLRALSAEILIRVIITTKLGIKNDEIVFETGQHGKPYLTGFDNFHFNLSHSGKWVVCAVSDLPVGIDVEQIKEIELNIANRFFSQIEAKDLFHKNENERLGYFFDLWTLKESYIKADGKGLSMPLNSFSFRVENDEIFFETDNELKDCYFKQYSIDRDYKLSVCSQVAKFPKSVLVKEFDDICVEFLRYVTS
ncbi:MAG: 4'-phosphopantetheinyl transferase family protein [Bacillota bacterium]